MEEEGKDASNKRNQLNSPTSRILPSPNPSTSANAPGEGSKQSTFGNVRANTEAIRSSSFAAVPSTAHLQTRRETKREFEARTASSVFRSSPGERVPSKNSLIDVLVESLMSSPCPEDTIKRRRKVNSGGSKTAAFLFRFVLLTVSHRVEVAFGWRVDGNEAVRIRGILGIF